jgi:hypothetical protein
MCPTLKNDLNANYMYIKINKKFVKIYIYFMKIYSFKINYF